jgi:hypothetical protein
MSGMQPPRPGNQDDGQSLGEMAVRGLFKLPWPREPVGAKGGKMGKAKGGLRARGVGRSRGRMRKRATPYP